VVVAELAVEAELVDVVEASTRDTGHLLVGGIDQVEEPGEGGTQGQAAPALVAHLAHPAQLTLQRPGVEVVRIVVVQLARGMLGGRNPHLGTAGSERRSMAAARLGSWPC
jgi:hypothetical protein